MLNNKLFFLTHVGCIYSAEFFSLIAYIQQLFSKFLLYFVKYFLYLKISPLPPPTKVQKLSKNEVLMVNIGSLSTGGRVSAVKADLGKIVLTNPVCTEVGEKIALSRRVEKHWRYVCQLSLFISKQ